MKTLYLSLIAVFIISYSQAQNFNFTDYQDNWNYYSLKYPFFTKGVQNLALRNPKNTDSKLKIKKVYSIKYKKGIKTKDTSYITVSQFDNGHITQYKHWVNGKLRDAYSFEYNADGYYTQFIISKKGKTYGTEHIAYNDSNKIVNYSYFKKGKPKEKRIIQYDDDNKRLKEEIYYNGHQIPDNIWKYEYWPGGKLKKTEYYKKGKLQHRYLYTCDEEGKEVADKKVETNLVCFITENNNDGSYIKVFRTTYGKGKVRKTKYTYSKDSLIIMYERENNKGVITNKHTYAYDDNGNRIKYTYYKRGGEKIGASYEYKYDDNHNTIEEKHFNAKGKLISRIVRCFDNDNRIISYVSYKGNGKVNIKTLHSYDAEGNIVKSIRYKGDRPIYEKHYEYVY